MHFRKLVLESGEWRYFIGHDNIVINLNSRIEAWCCDNKDAIKADRQAYMDMRAETTVGSVGEHYKKVANEFRNKTADEVCYMETLNIIKYITETLNAAGDNE